MASSPEPLLGLLQPTTTPVSRYETSRVPQAPVESSAGCSVGKFEWRGEIFLSATGKQMLLLVVRSEEAFFQPSLGVSFCATYDTHSTKKSSSQGMVRQCCCRLRAPSSCTSYINSLRASPPPPLSHHFGFFRPREIAAASKQCL